MESTPTEAAADVPYWEARPGTAPIKSEYVRWDLMRSGPKIVAIDDDAAEGRTRDERPQRAPEVVKDVAKEAAPVIASAQLPPATEASTSTRLEHTPPSDPEQGPPEKKIRLSGAQKKAAAKERSEIAWQAKKAEKEAEKEARAAAKAAGIEVEGAGEADGEGGGRKKGKGQNKGRKFDHRAGTDAIKLCVTAARGDECPRSKDGSCRWSHDVISYIAARSADIPISLPVSVDDLTLVNSDRICPLFTSLGQCPYGFKCRYGLSHMRKVADGEGALGSGWELVVDAEKVAKVQSERGEGVKERREKGEGNVISMERIKAIRGQGVEREDRFPLATAYLSSIGEPIDLREAVHGDTGAGHARGKGRGRGGRGGGRGGGGRDGGRPAADPEAAEASAATESAMEVDTAPVVAVSTEVLAGAIPPPASIDATTDATPLLPSTYTHSSTDALPPTEFSDIATDTITDATPPLPSADALPPTESSPPALIDIDSQPSRSFVPDLARVRATEKKSLDFRGKLYMAPLTTVGNLPFRRLAGDYGNDISCSEMGLAQELLVGNSSEWSLVRRHPSEKMFGVQICGSRPQALIPAAEAIVKACNIDFLDVNCGCPIDLVFNKGAGSALLQHATKLGKSLVGMSQVLGEVPLTIKIRNGVVHSSPVAHKLMPRMQKEWGVGAITIHGRSRAQRYKNLADYSYIAQCVKTVRESEADEGLPRIPIFGNGDAYDYRTYYENMEASGVDGIMIARGALIKPWIFTEIKERRDWDISSRERLDMVGKLASYGIEHWGSDTMGINTTRRFLCEALSFQHRYIPVGLLERFPIALNERAMPYRGRDELETLLASDQSEDWVKLTSMFLGPPPDEWSFQPKHKANATADVEVQG